MLTLTPESYCWWLAGYIEANGGAAPTPFEWTIIVVRLEALNHAQRAGAATSITSPARPNTGTTWGDPWTYRDAGGLISVC